MTLPSDRRILVLAPTGNDAVLTAQVLARAEIEVEVCRNVAELSREADHPCAALLLAEEVLNADSMPALVAALARQPAWSDLPVIIITSGGEADQARLRRLAVFGPGSNVTLLERPFRPGTLLSAAESALRSRVRQYQIRDLLQSALSSEERLRQSNAQVTMIIDHSPIGAYLVDSNLHLLQVNRKAEPIFGAARNLTGCPLGEVMRNVWAPAVVEDIEARFRHTLESGESYFVTDFAENRLDRSKREYYEWQIHRIVLPDGRYGVVCYFIDISAHVTAQQRISSARDTAERASRAKDDFLAALSHELRTPLNPVLLLATEAAADSSVPPALRADFDTIAKNVLLEARLIDDLLDLTRITRSKLSLDTRPTAIHGVLRDAIANVMADVREKHLTLSVELGSGDPIVECDPVRLQQVFWNVLKNAAKFTPARGKIAVRTWIAPPSGPLVIAISDTGAGIKAEDLNRIFEAFAQGEQATKSSPHRFGGLGLGLAISHTLVELHSGSIRATSPGLGLGSTFTIELPLASAPASREPKAETGPIAGPGPNVTVPALRILLVEDHAPTRTALAQLLRARHHYVVAASSVAEARNFGTTQTFDLLLTDIGLPDGDGYELMVELGKLHGLKGVALTGYGAEEDVERAKKSGFIAHLVKPVSVRTLDSVLNSVDWKESRS